MVPTNLLLIFGTRFPLRLVKFPPLSIAPDPLVALGLDQLLFDPDSTHEQHPYDPTPTGRVFQTQETYVDNHQWQSGQSGREIVLQSQQMHHQWESEEDSQDTQQFTHEFVDDSQMTQQQFTHELPNRLVNTLKPCERQQVDNDSDGLNINSGEDW